MSVDLVELAIHYFQKAFFFLSGINMPNIIPPIVSSSPPPLDPIDDDNDEDDNEDDFGDFTVADFGTHSGVFLSF